MKILILMYIWFWLYKFKFFNAEDEKFFNGSLRVIVKKFQVLKNERKYKNWKKQKKGYVISGPTHGVLFLKNAPLKCIILP